MNAVGAAWQNAALGGIKPIAGKSAFWLAFVFPVLIFLAAHGSYYFHAAVEESGDCGANALQIQNAKGLAELHGNYSRFHFNHPGPAFFYVYAAGEAWLHDLIPLARSPATAHSLAGLLLQSAFFAGALFAYSRFFPRRQTVIAAIVAAGFHFCATGEAFGAIWPPYQLLMPYFCALVAAAAVMAGAITFLPLLVLAACFCVHGHVAQTVFMVPVFGSSVGWLWITQWRCFRRSQPGHGLRLATRKIFWNRWGLASALIVALFVFPLAVDALSGRSSNFMLIMNHVRHSQAIAKPLSDSAVYNLSYLRYWSGLGDIPHGTMAWNLQHYLGVTLAWVLSVVCPFSWWLVRRRRWTAARHCGEATGPDWRANFVAALLALFFLTAGLAVFWGTRIEEEMFSFNSYFIYGTLALPIVACVGIAGEYIRIPVAALAVFLAAAGLALLFIVRPQILPQDVGIPVLDSVPALQALARKTGREDPARCPFVYLTFPHGEWADATIVALHLSQHKIEWRVPAEWGFIFGANHGLAARDVPGLSRACWVSIQKEPPPASSPSLLLPSQDYLILGEEGETALDPAAFPRAFSRDTEFFRNATGLSNFDLNSDAVWGEGAVTLFPLQVSAANADVIITFDLEPLVHPPALLSQEFNVWLGRILVGHYSLERRESVPIRISRAIWNQARGQSGKVDLAFYWESSAAPLDVGLNDDHRPLAVEFRTVRFELSPQGR